MRDTTKLLVRSVTDFPPLKRKSLEILQLNLGYRCNMSCSHCHVNAGPSRTETMSDEVIELVLQAVEQFGTSTVDVTGGAPEMHPRFRELVVKVRGQGAKLIDRCNLTILLEPGYEDLPEFFAQHQVEIVASLPCYSEENVAKQRGKGVFASSIEAIQKLNACGYGKPGSGLRLNLVYNPLGPNLPPEQQALQKSYKENLQKDFGIVFNELFTLANMPIARFGATLLAKNQFETYLQLLRESYNPKTLESVMCRNTVSVDWQGFVYDCDFNQMLELPLGGDRSWHLRDVMSELMEEKLQGRSIAVADHCYGCTAGQGSSCGGALQ